MKIGQMSGAMGAENECLACATFCIPYMEMVSSSILPIFMTDHRLYDGNFANDTRSKYSSTFSSFYFLIFTNIALIC